MGNVVRPVTRPETRMPLGQFRRMYDIIRVEARFSHQSGPMRLPQGPILSLDKARTYTVPFAANRRATRSSGFWMDRQTLKVQRYRSYTIGLYRKLQQHYRAGKPNTPCQPRQPIFPHRTTVGDPRNREKRAAAQVDTDDEDISKQIQELESRKRRQQEARSACVHDSAACSSRAARQRPSVIDQELVAEQDIRTDETKVCDARRAQIATLSRSSWNDSLVAVDLIWRCGMP